MWTQDNVVRSPCKDIVIPDTTVNEYIWRNLDKWATKTATVMSKMFVLYRVLLLIFLQFMVRGLFFNENGVFLGISFEINILCDCFAFAGTHKLVA